MTSIRTLVRYGLREEQNKCQTKLTSAKRPSSTAELFDYTLFILEGREWPCSLSFSKSKYYILAGASPDSLECASVEPTIGIIWMRILLIAGKEGISGNGLIGFCFWESEERYKPLFFKEKGKKNSRQVNRGDIFQNMEDGLCISHQLYKTFYKLKELFL